MKRSVRLVALNCGLLVGLICSYVRGVPASILTVTGILLLSLGNALVFVRYRKKTTGVPQSKLDR